MSPTSGLSPWWSYEPRGVVVVGRGLVCHLLVHRMAGVSMSIVTDRRCDGCGEIKPGKDEEWFALIPAGWDGVDHRLDFCNPSCIAKFIKTEKFKELK